MSLSFFQRAYIGLIVALGATVLGLGVHGFYSDNIPRLIAYMIIGVASAGMKVRLPSIMGTMSMNFVFLLISISELGLGETLLLGAISSLVQCLVGTKHRPKILQVVFSVASVVFSLRVAYYVHHVSDVRSFVLTTAVFFLTNTLIVTFVIALTENKNAWNIWKSSYFWTFPSYMVGAFIAWLMAQADRMIGWEAALLIVPVLYVIYRTHRLQIENLEEAKARAEEQRAHAEEVAALHRRTIETLALAIECKDETTHDHLQRVEVYATEVGRELGMDEIELTALRAAALLHDVGKIGVPEYIIAKPGKLTPEEFEKMKTHTIVGAELVERINFPYSVAPMVRGHHEKWNGTGYPDGLSGTAIPVGARILAAVDTLDALASDRQYRKAMPLNEAIKIVIKESGAAFDPAVVDILSRRYEELELKARTGVKIKKFSTDVKVEKGAGPDAGFAKVATAAKTADETAVTRAEIHKKITNALETSVREAIVSTLKTSLPDVVPFDVMMLYLRDGDTLIPQQLERKAESSMEVRLGEGISGWVAEHGQSIVNANANVETGYLSGSEGFRDLHAAMSVPLYNSGAVAGVLSLYRKDRDSFTTDNLNALNATADIVSLALCIGDVRQKTV